jgi:hypothetical protein
MTRMTTRKVIGIVIATNAAILAVLLLALWSASSVVAVPSALQQAAALSAPGNRPAEAAPTPVPGGPGYYSVSSAEMRAADSTIGYNHWDGLSTTLESTVNPLSETLYGAGLHLPQGARVTRLVAYGYDDDDDKDFTFSVLRSTVTSKPTSDFVVIPTESDTGSTPFVKEVAAFEDNATVDNSVYSYEVIVSLPAATSGKRLVAYQFRVDYTFDHSMPLAMKKY